MLIYKNTTAQFVEDVRKNVLTDIMVLAFCSRWGRSPAVQELNSWQNSLSRVRDLIELADLTDNYVALEYEVPYNQSRIDCLLFGRATNRVDNITLLELKQWSAVEPLPEEGNFVETYTGGAQRVVPHPSQQVKGYHQYLTRFITEFETQPVLLLFSCTYCHNYVRTSDTGLFAPMYTELLQSFPIYTKTDTEKLAEKIRTLLNGGRGTEVFNRFMRSPVKPCLKLLENVSNLIRNEHLFSLLNEQLVAKNLIWAKVRKGQKCKTKSVIIVHGGPGTGKSLIAINLLAEAAGANQNVAYGCKSKPFRSGLQHLVGADAAMLFSNLYEFVPSKKRDNELDLLLIDEAHRIEKKASHQFMPASDRSDMPQTEQLIRCARTSVFFIDDRQNVRSQEIGSSDLIRLAANNLRCEVSEVTLVNQFRCMGSNDYLLWVESVLGYGGQRRILSKNEVFDFRIFSDPQSLYSALEKIESEKPNSARLTAGFCWPWSKSLSADGSLVKDVKIGTFEMPWETHGEISRPPKGYVKWYEWAFKPEGFKQVGCIYTAQGFEFDYIGVIIGDDLTYDPFLDELKADIRATKDPTLKRHKKNFEMHVKNIYRTLLTRGMKGCFVFFTNKEAEKFFRRFIAK